MAKKTSKLLYEGSEWTMPLMNEMLEAVEQIGKEELKLDLYPNQVELVNAEQMLDGYSSVGLPVLFSHWSFGKSFAINSNRYNKGQQNLAYETVINSDPCIAYCMQENTATMQLLVLAHACVGHNAVFKGNRLFQEWTDASSIIDYMVYAKDYVAHCEEKYGLDKVEAILDAAMALQNCGVDRYKRPHKLSLREEKERKEKLEAEQQASVNLLWNSIPKPNVSEAVSSKYEELESRQKLLGLPQENLLYFLEKKSPILEPWQREIVRIVRKFSQYLIPSQVPTKLLNEGFATWTHHHILKGLHEAGRITDGSYLEFIDSHCGVTFQPSHDSPYYSGLNVYALGFNIYRDIERMCKEPTKEDERWFPDIVGTNYVETLKNAMSEYRDDSFISQFLSPKVIRDMQLFSVYNDSNDDHYQVTNIHDDEGYKKIISDLSFNYNPTNHSPNIQLRDVNLLGDRTLYLDHEVINGKRLDKKAAKATLYYLQTLWGYSVKLTDREGQKVLYECGWDPD